MKTIAILTLLLWAAPVSAQRPDVFVQWSLKNPQGWERVTDWKALPKRPIPRDGEIGGTDDLKGWVAAVRIGNVTLEGFDHYAVIATATRVRFLGWIDDPTDPKRAGRLAQECTFTRSVEPDCTYFSHEEYAKFRPPAKNITRHGVWLPLVLWVEHIKARDGTADAVK